MEHATGNHLPEYPFSFRNKPKKVTLNKQFTESSHHLTTVESRKGYYDRHKKDQIYSSPSSLSSLSSSSSYRKERQQPTKTSNILPYHQVSTPTFNPINHIVQSPSSVSSLAFSGSERVTSSDSSPINSPIKTTKLQRFPLEEHETPQWKHSILRRMSPKKDLNDTSMPEDKLHLKEKNIFFTENKRTVSTALTENEDITQPSTSYSFHKSEVLPGVPSLEHSQNLEPLLAVPSKLKAYESPSSSSVLVKDTKASINANDVSAPSLDFSFVDIIDSEDMITGIETIQVSLDEHFKRSDEPLEYLDVFFGEGNSQIDEQASIIPSKQPPLDYFKSSDSKPFQVTKRETYQVSPPSNKTTLRLGETIKSLVKYPKETERVLMKDVEKPLKQNDPFNKMVVSMENQLKNLSGSTPWSGFTIPNKTYQFFIQDSINSLNSHLLSIRDDCEAFKELFWERLMKTCTVLAAHCGSKELLLRHMAALVTSALVEYKKELSRLRKSFASEKIEFQYSLDEFSRTTTGKIEFMARELRKYQKFCEISNLGTFETHILKLEKTIKEQQDNEERLRRLLESESSKYGQLEHLYEMQRTHFEEQRTEMKIYEEKIRENATCILSLQMETEELKIKMALEKDKYMEEHQRRLSVETELSNTQAELHKQTKQFLETSVKVNQVNLEKKGVEESKERLLRKIAGLQEQVDLKAKDIESLNTLMKKELEESVQKIARTKEERDTLEKETILLKATISNINHQKQTIQEKEATTSSENSSLASVIKQLSNENRKLQEEVLKANFHRQAAQEKLDMERNKRDELVTKLTLQNSKLERKNTSLLLSMKNKDLRQEAQYEYPELDKEKSGEQNNSQMHGLQNKFASVVSSIGSLLGGHESKLNKTASRESSLAPERHGIILKRKLFSPRGRRSTNGSVVGERIGNNLLDICSASESGLPQKSSTTRCASFLRREDDN